MDAFPQPSAIGRGPSDAELAALHGGGETCVITITSDGKVTTSGDCSKVTIKER